MYYACILYSCIYNYTVGGELWATEGGVLWATEGGVLWATPQGWLKLEHSTVIITRKTYHLSTIAKIDITKST